MSKTAFVVIGINKKIIFLIKKDFMLILCWLFAMRQALSVEQSLVGRGEGRSPRAENEARVDGRETGEEIGVQRRRFVLIYLLGGV